MQTETPAAARRRRPPAVPRRRIAAALALLLAVAGCAHQPRGYDRRVLVMDFQNLIPGDANSQLGSTLADLLTANLANHPRISMVERQNTPALAGLGWQDAGRKTAVDYVIVGSLSRLDDNYIVAIRLLSMVTGEVVKGSGVERSCNREEDLYPVVSALGAVMAQHLQVLSERYEAWVQQQPQGLLARMGLR